MNNQDAYTQPFLSLFWGEKLIKSKTLIVISVFNLLFLILFNVAGAQGQASSNNYDCSTVILMPQTECEALVALDVVNPEATLPSDWFSNQTPCGWSSIECRSSNIDQLILNFAGISSLPTEIGNLDDLTRLSLIGNQLTTLPEEVGNLHSLEYFSIYENQLTTLPAEIGNLSALLYLGLSDNQLTELPAEIGDLERMAWLHVSKNQLTQLPAELGSLVGLITLDVDNNQLTGLPSTITALTPTTLNIHMNSLCIVDAGIADWLNSNDPAAIYAFPCQPLIYLPKVTR